jgi:hypothetical protein
MPRKKRHQHEYPNSRIQREKEEADFEAFAVAYLAATGLTLEDVGSDSGTQDFTCERSDGKTVGVEFTELRRGISPDEVFWQSILYRRYEMDSIDAVDEFWRLIEQKSAKRINYSTKYNIILVQNCDADFHSLFRLSLHIPYEDYRGLGLREIWLGDYRGIREGAHREIELYGIYPRRIRGLTPRSGWDLKPYG